MSDEAFLGAIKAGDLQEIKRLHQGGHLENECPWDAWACRAAALRGHLECLKYLHENGCPWDAWTCRAAAEGGQLECLKYLHENGCPWDDDTCAQAARHLECLKYARENGCPWGTITCMYAAGGGRLECLKYAHENGCPWDERSTVAAACGNLECLKYLHENGCPRHVNVCTVAAACGHLECLKYAHENGFPCNIDQILNGLSVHGYDAEYIEAYLKACMEPPNKCPYETAMATLDDAVREGSMTEGKYKTIADALMHAHRAKRSRE